MQRFIDTLKIAKSLLFDRKIESKTWRFSNFLNALKSFAYDKKFWKVKVQRLEVHLLFYHRKIYFQRWFMADNFFCCTKNRKSLEVNIFFRKWPYFFPLEGLCLFFMFLKMNSFHVNQDLSMLDILHSYKSLLLEFINKHETPKKDLQKYTMIPRLHTV